MSLRRMLLVVLLAGGPSLIGQTDTIQWMDSLEAATARARDLDRPLMIVFR